MQSFKLCLNSYSFKSPYIFIYSIAYKLFAKFFVEKSLFKVEGKIFVGLDKYIPSKSLFSPILEVKLG